MVVSISTMACLFCDSPICFMDGDMDNFQSHIEFEHEVAAEKQELVFAMSMLSENETKVLIHKIKPRKEHFLKQEKHLLNQDIFKVDEENVQDVLQTQSIQIEQIQQMLNGDFSDSDSDSDDEGLVNDTPRDGVILEERIVKKKGLEEGQLCDRDANAIGAASSISKPETCIDDSEESLEKLLQEEVDVNYQVGCDMKSAPKSNDPIRNIHMNKLVSQSENLVKPCNVLLQKWVGDSRQLEEKEDKTSVDDLSQEDILQNVSCKMEIGEYEVHLPEADPEPSSDIRSINLVDKLTRLNHCRLCFTSYSEEDNLKRHEESVHGDDQEALALSFFTLTDLVFSCSMCPQIPGFLTENILNKHKQLQHKLTVKNTVAKCDNCQKVVKYHGLKAHMLTHTQQEKKYECNLCYKKFLKLCYLQNHRKSIHSKETHYFNKNLTEGDLKFNCEVCNLKFVTETVLKYHKKIHEKRKVYSCQFCTILFENPKLFKIHCIKVHGKRAVIDGSDKKFRCKLCYTGFKKLGGLTAHKKIHTEDQGAFERTLEDSELKFTCSKCEQRFVSRHILDYHVNRNHKKYEFEELKLEARENNGNYKCKLCYTSFKRFSFLNHHIIQCHEQDKSLLNKVFSDADLRHSCEQCGLKFVTAKILEYHNRRVHMKKKEKPHTKTEKMHKKTEKFTKCDICSKVLTTHSLPKHKLTHTTERNHQCQLCYQKFKVIWTMKEHQKNMHKSDIEVKYLSSGGGADCLQFQCQKCDLSFLTDHLLESHLRRHEGNKMKHRYSFKNGKEKECKLCYVKFKKQSNLISHQKKVHKNDIEFLNRELSEADLKFDCSECDQKFVSNDILIAHIRKHLMLKFEFLRKDAYSETIGTFKCKLCFTEFKSFSYLVSHANYFHKADIELLKRNINNDELINSCGECELKFATEQLLDYHNSKCHLDQSTRHCKLCNLEFKSNSGFVMHKDRIHMQELAAFRRSYEEKDYIFGCRKCSKKFATEISLNHHLARKHTNAMKKKSTQDGKKTIKIEKQEKYCQLCHIMYKEPRYLRLHKKRVHAGEMEAFDKDLSAADMKEVCTKCNQKMYSKSTLEFHMNRKHKQYGNSEFCCQLCYINLTFNSNLKKHMEVVHKNDLHLLEGDLDESILTHSCTCCDKKFAGEHILKYHMRYNHKEERRQDISCEYCNKLFKWSHGRKRVINNHMKNTHNMDEYKVDEQAPVLKENETVKNFMDLLNSLTMK